MLFMDAKKKLEKIANGRFHAIEYSCDVYEDGSNIVNCTVYIDGYRHQAGSTWNKALEKLKLKIKNEQMSPTDLSESPPSDDFL